MRQPTPAAIAFAWHADAVAQRELYRGRNVARGFAPDHDGPQCGWYKVRVERAGCDVPARIWLYQPIDDDTGELCGDEVLRCEIDGRLVSTDDLEAFEEERWPFLAHQPITQDEFDYLVALRRWQRANAPDELRDKRRIDHLETPIPE